MLIMLQARGATKDAANARQQGYLKAALEGAMAKASQVGPDPSTQQESCEDSSPKRKIDLTDLSWAS